MSKQPPLAPTVSAVGPCRTIIKISRTPWHWKFTPHHPTTPVPVRPNNLGKAGQRPAVVAADKEWGFLYVYVCF